MINKKCFFLINMILLMFCFSSAPILGANDQMMKGFPQSEEEFAQWQKEIDSQIDEYVNSLPEDQKKEFYKQVDELTDLMNNMSDDELLEFVETVFSEEGMEEAPAPAPIEEE